MLRASEGLLSQLNNLTARRCRSYLMFWTSMASVSCTVYQHCP